LRRSAAPTAKTHRAFILEADCEGLTLFPYKKEMSSSLSMVVNIIQILSFVVQLLQAGPDLMSRIPDFVRSGRAWLRSMRSGFGAIIQAWYRADRIITDLHDDTHALEEGRVGVEWALIFEWAPCARGVSSFPSPLDISGRSLCLLKDIQHVSFVSWFAGCGILLYWKEWSYPGGKKVEGVVRWNTWSGDAEDVRVVALTYV
jgi:hypothetical protein